MGEEEWDWCPRARFHRVGVRCKGCHHIREALERPLTPYERAYGKARPKSKGADGVAAFVVKTPQVAQPQAANGMFVKQRPDPFRHWLDLDREAPEGGGLMLAPRASDCLTERLVWNQLRRLERNVDQWLNKIWEQEQRAKRQQEWQEEYERDRRFNFKVNEGAVWTLGHTGATTCWNITGKMKKSLPTLDGYDGNWGFNG